MSLPFAKFPISSSRISVASFSKPASRNVVRRNPYDTALATIQSWPPTKTQALLLQLPSQAHRNILETAWKTRSPLPQADRKTWRYLLSKIEIHDIAIQLSQRGQKQTTDDFGLVDQIPEDYRDHFCTSLPAPCQRLWKLLFIPWLRKVSPQRIEDRLRAPLIPIWNALKRQLDEFRQDPECYLAEWRRDGSFSPPEIEEFRDSLVVPEEKIVFDRFVFALPPLSLKELDEKIKKQRSVIRQKIGIVQAKLMDYARDKDAYFNSLAQRRYHDAAIFCLPPELKGEFVKTHDLSKIDLILLEWIVAERKFSSQALIVEKLSAALGQEITVQHAMSARRFLELEILEFRYPFSYRELSRNIRRQRSLNASATELPKTPPPLSPETTRSDCDREALQKLFSGLAALADHQASRNFNRSLSLRQNLVLQAAIEQKSVEAILPTEDDFSSWGNEIRDILLQVEARLREWKQDHHAYSNRYKTGTHAWTILLDDLRLLLPRDFNSFLRALPDDCRDFLERCLTLEPIAPEDLAARLEQSIQKIYKSKNRIIKIFYPTCLKDQLPNSIEALVQRLKALKYRVAADFSVKSLT